MRFFTTSIQRDNFGDDTGHCCLCRCARRRCSPDPPRRHPIGRGSAQGALCRQAHASSSRRSAHDGGRRTHCPRLANDYGNKGDCVTDIEYALQHYGTVNNEIVRHLAEAGGRVYDIIDGGNLYRSRDGFTYLRFFASPEMVNRLIAKYLGDDVTMVRVDDIMNFTRAAFGPPFTPEFCQVLRPMVPRTLSIILCQHWCFSPLALPGTRTYLTRHRSVILRFDKPFRRGRRV